MRTSILWMLLTLLTVVRALAGTHVNISISQQHSKNDAHLVHSNSKDDQLVQLKSDGVEEIRSSGQYVENAGRSARLEVNDKDDQQVKHTSNHKVEGSSMTGRVALEGVSGRVLLVQPQYQHRSMYTSSPIEYQRNGQFRQMSNQQKQNMEFERYIQHYHSAPTVETVFDAADVAPAQSGSARVKEQSHGQRSAKLVKFERQVALPAAQATSSESQQHQSAQVSEKSSAASVVAPASSSSVAASSSVPASAGVSAATSGGSSYHISINQRPASVGSDGLNFDQSNSYNKPSYNEPSPTFKYNNDDSDIHFQNQYPPSVEEPQGGYGGYFQPSYVGGGYDQHYNGHSYIPAEAPSQRAVVKKTIQIAQPAIKTKKYEVRHPAIQKEFYDIEERVLIKPAGTVVVELERPVAKIPKGESILPLGHPHPAVAGAYMNNGNTPSFSNIIYSAAGGSHQNQPANQYNPTSDYNAKQVPGSGSTLASSITSNPRYDQGSKELAVEANLNKQYNGDSHFTAAPAPVTLEESKPKNREVIVVTDGQGHQRQVSTDQFSYSRDETDKPSPSRSVYNLRSYSNHNNVAQQRSNYQPTHSNRNDYNFEAEYISNSGNTNAQRESKPARLEEAPTVTVDRQQAQPIIKQNIYVAPSQHKIYLTRKEEVPQSRYIEEKAHVQEVKPYLRNQRGPMIVYAATKPRQELNFRPAGEYRPQSQVVQYRNNDRSFHKAVESNQPEISAPYAQMRYHSDDRNLRAYAASNDRESKKYGRLIIEDTPAEDTKSSNENEKEKEKISHSTTTMKESQTSIEINIPQMSQDSHKPIVVSSTLRPMVSDDGQTTHNAKLEISITNNGEPKETPPVKAKEQEDLAEVKEAVDCDKKLKSSSNLESEQKFMRLVEASSESNAKESALTADSTASNVQTSNVDVVNKGASGHHHHKIADGAGSRVIAATPAPKDPSSASESFHKRRIVVNHPFQTVREVVEHEPYTNYHEVQVNEPASPALYHSANYYQPHGALRDGRERDTSSLYYQ